MPGINTTGLPQTGDYTVGRGIAYFARLDANGFPQEYRDLGNMPSLKASLSTTLIEHLSSRQGLKQIDAQIVTQQKIAVTLELDEFNFNNLALALAGDAASFANSTAVAGVASDAAGDVTVYAKGRWYDLYQATTGEPTTAGSNPADKRAYDIGTLTVKDAAGAITYALGTDYVADLKMGRIFIMSTGTIAAAADGSVKIRVSYAANASADATPAQVQALTNAGGVGALKFILQNPANNNQLYEFQFHKIQLVAEGELSLIGDEPLKITLKGDAQQNLASSPNSPVLTIRTHTHANG